MRDPEVERWLSHAEAMIAQSNHVAALDALKRVLAREPEHAVAHGMLALVLIDARRLEAAEHEARTAVALEPEEPDTHYALAFVLMEARRLDEADQELDAALELDAEDPDYHHLRAQLRIRQNRFRDANDALDEALRIKPDHHDVVITKGELAHDTGDLEAARAAADDVLSALPEHGGAHILKGRLDLRDGDLAAARDHVHFALSLDPDDRLALELLVGIKTRESTLLGLWWRWSMLTAAMTERRTIAVLLGTFVAIQLLIIVASELDLPRAAEVLNLVWTAFCAYTWIGPVLFRRALDKELERVELSDEF